MADTKTDIVCTKVNPGICGFTCIVKVQKNGARTVAIEIIGSGCNQIQKLSGLIQEMSLVELFKPITVNPVMIAAQSAGCHTTCTIPLAILKSAEVALGMALPRDVKLNVSIDENCAKDI